MSSAEWTVRDFLPDDENCVVSTWLKSYAHAREVRGGDFPSANIDGHPDEIRFWRVHQPIVEALTRFGQVRVVCDPNRATYDNGPAVVWAWSCTSEDTVHWVCVKRSVVRAGFGEDIVRDLLGERLERPQQTTFELVDLAKLKMVPEDWFRATHWLSALRDMSARTLEADSVFARVGAHVLDARRASWRSASERAA